MSARRTPALIALLLVSVSLAPLALAASHEHHAHGHDHHATEARDHGQSWSDVKAALKTGDVAGARTQFDASFGGAAAARHAVAASVADAAFAALANATDPASAFYKAQAQLVDKSVYAIAYANLRAEIAAGDLEAAKAWFGVLQAKFSKETDLPAAKAAFGNLTNDTAEDALATLRAEYTDLILGKVIKETSEAPGLLLADPVKSAEEAAEGLGYYLSIQPDVVATLGAELDASIRAELAHLLDESLDEEEDATHRAAEMEHITAAAQALVARYTLATAPAAKADAYTTYAAAMKQDKDLVAARAAYDAAFAHAAEESAPAAHERVLTAFAAAQVALDAGNEAEYHVQRQILEKSAYEIALAAFTHEAMEGETDEALGFYLVLVEKFKWADEPPAGVLAAARIAAANKADDDAIAAAKAVAFEAFFGKVREEVEEVFMHWDDTPKARVKAMEGVVYFAPLKQDVETRLGAAVATEMESELLELYEATTAQDRAKAEHAAEEIEKLLVQYEAGGAEVSELAAVVSSLKGKIDFVAEEFHGYYEAKAIGDETEANIEMGEAQAFLAGARQQFEANLDAFEAVDADAAAKVLANMDRMKEILDAVGDLEELETLATQTVEIVAAFAAAPAAPPVGKVSAIWKDARLDGDFVLVKLALQGLPEQGAAFQLKVKFDPALVEIAEAEVLYGDVKASNIDNEKGIVAFNAAATAGAADADVLLIKAQPKAADAATLLLEVEAEEIVDDKNNAYALGSVAGSKIELAALSTPSEDLADGSALGASTGKNETPGFAALFGIAALAAVALVLRGRKED